MNKKILCGAILCAIAGGASAAEVQLYGIIDEGLSYVRKDLDDGNSANDEFGTQ